MLELNATVPKPGLKIGPAKAVSGRNSTSRRTALQPTHAQRESGDLEPTPIALRPEIERRRSRERPLMLSQDRFSAIGSSAYFSMQ